MGAIYGWENIRLGFSYYNRRHCNNGPGNELNWGKLFVSIGRTRYGGGNPAIGKNPQIPSYQHVTETKHYKEIFSVTVPLLSFSSQRKASVALNLPGNILVFFYYFWWLVTELNKVLRLNLNFFALQQFICGLSLCCGTQANLSRDEIQKIVEVYRQSNGRVRYKEFCDIMENG